MAKKNKTLKKYLLTSIALGVACLSVGVGMSLHLGKENDDIYAKYSDAYKAFNTQYVQDETQKLDEQLASKNITQEVYNYKLNNLNKYGYGEYRYVKNYGNSADVELISSNARRADNNLFLGTASGVALVGAGLVMGIFSDSEQDPNKSKQCNGQSIKSTGKVK